MGGGQGVAGGWHTPGTRAPTRQPARAKNRMSAIVPLLCAVTALRTWPITVLVNGRSHEVVVPENEPVLAAVERAGLLPG